MSVHLAFKRAGLRSINGQLLPVEFPALLSLDVTAPSVLGTVQSFAAPATNSLDPLVLVVQADTDADVWVAVGRDPKASLPLDRVKAGQRVQFAVSVGDRVGLTATPPPEGSTD